MTIICAECGMAAERKLARARYCSRTCKNRVTVRKWRHQHPERERAATRKYAETHVEQVREYRLSWQRANRGRLQEYSRRYYGTPNGKAKHRSNIYARRNKAAGALDFVAWLEKLERLEGRCQNCGTREDITIDHIRPLSKGGTNHIDNLQPLCRSCNASKGAKILPGTQMALLVARDVKRIS